MLRVFALQYSRDTVTVEFDNDTQEWHQTKEPKAPTQNVPDVANPSPIVCSYSGKLVDGKPTGFGILTIQPETYAYMTTYKGNWKDGKFHGKGTLFTEFSSHSRKYSGNFKNGLRHGFGRDVYMGGSYIGFWKNDERYMGNEQNW